MVSSVEFVISKGKNFSSGPKLQLQSLKASCGKSFIKMKRESEIFCHRQQKGAERVSLASLARHLYTFSIGY